MARQHHDGTQATFGPILQTQPAVVKYNRVTHDRQPQSKATGIEIA
jgi:hypothetical protein